MKRYVSLEEITDGNLYQIDDMVKVGSNGCAGCSNCCKDSDDTIKLDPWDIYTLTTGLNTSFEALLGGGYIELKAVDGIILPNLKLDKERGCMFLNEQGRCSIHKLRPGFCRLFPLGRYYHDDTFSYILQVHECPNNKVKVKVSKWIDLPDYSLREKFAGDWHYYLKGIEKLLVEHKDSDEERKINMKLLTDFFITPYTNGDFYREVYERMNKK